MRRDSKEGEDETASGSSGSVGSVHGLESLGTPVRRGSITQPLGKVSISDFAVMGKLGEGGYGTVLLGKHKLSSSVVALKMLTKDAISSDVHAERVLGEAEALSEVSHPFIVSMLGAFQDELHIFSCSSSSAVATCTTASSSTAG